MVRRDVNTREKHRVVKLRLLSVSCAVILASAAVLGASSVSWATGPIQFAPLTPIAGSPALVDLGKSKAVADFDGDGFADALVSPLAGPVINFGGPNPGTQDLTALALPGNLADIGDFNGDGRADIVLASSSRNQLVGVLPGLGAGTGADRAAFGPVVPIGGSTQRTLWKVYDVNADGADDFVLYDQVFPEVYSQVRFGAKTGPLFTNLLDLVPALVFLDIKTADLNGDGFVDLVVGASDSGQGVGQVYEGGQSGFTPGAVFRPLGFSGFGAILGDVNGDGLLDIGLDGSEQWALQLNGPSVVVAEAPIALLLPLTALAVFAGSVAVRRRQARPA
jgi:hypothetical protein